MLVALSKEKNDETISTVEPINATHLHAPAASGKSKSVEIPDAETSNVTIAIGKETHVFLMKDLARLPYFAIMFSSRWFFSSDHERRLEQPIKIFDNDDNPIFGLNDLKLLLKYMKLRHIPNTLALNLKQLESLVNCSDYLTTGDPCTCGKINKNNLVQYFHIRIPPITVSQRKQWLIECNNKLIRESLMEYDQLLQKQLSIAQSNALSIETVSKRKMLLNVEYDADTAADLFRTNFSFHVIFDNNKNNKNEMKIKIKDYDQDLWNHLYSSFSHDIIKYWHYFGKDIEYIVQELIRWNDRNSDNPNLKIICSKNEKSCIGNMLDRIMDDLIWWHNYKSPMIGIVIPPSISVCSLVVARMNLCHGRLAGKFSDIAQDFSKYLSYFDESECEKVLTVFVKSHGKYITMINSPNVNQSKNKAMESWYVFLKNLLRFCSARVLVANASLWFPIGHDISKLEASVLNNINVNSQENKSNGRDGDEENDHDIDSSWIKEYLAKWDNFIFNEIIPKFGTQNAFNFGLSLIDYIMFCKSKPKMKQFDQRYFDFLKEHVGIMWNLT